MLDEADHMADLGFLPAVTRLLGQTSPNGQRLLFSATLDRAVDGLVRRFLKRPATHEADSAQSPVAAMDHHVLHIPVAQRTPVVADLASAPGRILVFTRTKSRAKALTKQLNAQGIPAVELHGNLNQNARTRNMKLFQSGEVETLVATDIAARGIHVDDIELVVHADPPVEHKAYLHRSGRTARAGKAGTVITLMTDDQARDVRTLTEPPGSGPSPPGWTPWPTRSSANWHPAGGCCRYDRTPRRYDRTPRRYDRTPHRHNPRPRRSALAHRAGTGWRRLIGAATARPSSARAPGGPDSSAGTGSRLEPVVEELQNLVDGALLAIHGQGGVSLALELDPDERGSDLAVEPVETRAGRRIAGVTEAEHPTAGFRAGPDDCEVGGGEAEVVGPALPMGNGRDGWATTGATTASSTIIAKAKPPVKHMPRAPTPGPPSSPCSSRASARSQVATGEVRPTASLLNSRFTHTRGRVVAMAPKLIGAPAVPNRLGMTTVNSASTTSSAKVMTSGVMPGSSWMTMTPGPVPRR